MSVFLHLFLSCLLFLIDYPVYGQEKVPSPGLIGQIDPQKALAIFNQLHMPDDINVIKLNPQSLLLFKNDLEISEGFHACTTQCGVGYGSYTVHINGDIYCQCDKPKTRVMPTALPHALKINKDNMPKIAAQIKVSSDQKIGMINYKNITQFQNDAPIYGFYRQCKKSCADMRPEIALNLMTGMMNCICSPYTDIPVEAIVRKPKPDLYKKMMKKYMERQEDSSTVLGLMAASNMQRDMAYQNQMQKMQNDQMMYQDQNNGMMMASDHLSQFMDRRSHGAGDMYGQNFSEYESHGANRSDGSQSVRDSIRSTESSSRLSGIPLGDSSNGRRSRSFSVHTPSKRNSLFKAIPLRKRQTLKKNASQHQPNEMLDKIKELEKLKKIIKNKTS